jgi:hypothetical protein
LIIVIAGRLLIPESYGFRKRRFSRNAAAQADQWNSGGSRSGLGIQAGA